MKNIFTWSVLVSIFTIFFYWFGYWYTQGYISYFGVSIESYELAIQHILIKGFLNSITETMILLVALAFMSFFFQFSRQQIAVFFHRVFFLLVYIIVFIVTLVKKIAGEKKGGIYHNIGSSRVFQFSLIKKLLELLKSIFKACRSIFSCLCSKFIFLKEIHIQMIKKEPFKLLEVEKELLKKQVNINSHKFDTQYSLHSFVLIFIMWSLLVIIDHTVDINEKGRSSAEKNFECSIHLTDNDCNRFSIITVNNQKWFLTDICINSKCVIVNDKKQVKIIDIVGKLIVKPKESLER